MANLNKLTQIKSKIKNLPDIDKLKLANSILESLDKPDPELDEIWANEAKKRLGAYKKGKIKSTSYEDVMKKYSFRED